MNYEQLIEEIPPDFELPTVAELSPEDVIKNRKREFSELNNRKKELKVAEIALKIQYSNPELIKEVSDLTALAAVEIFQANSDDIARIAELTVSGTRPMYKAFAPEQVKLFEERKNKEITGLHTKVIENEVVRAGVNELKEAKTLNLKKHIHRKKPSDYLDSLRTARELKLLREEIADIRAIQERDREENARKFEQIGVALLSHEAEISLLKQLGLESKKIEAYRLKLNNPGWSVERVAEELGKGRTTVYRWLQEIEDAQNLT